MGLFGTAGIRGTVGEWITPELALSVGRAVGEDARARDRSLVFVGRDGRVTGDGLATAVEAGLSSAGVSVRRTGPVPTPALAFASRSTVGVMVTASHNPPGDNGIKLFEGGIEYDRDRERRIQDLVDSGPDPAAWDEWGTAETVNVLDSYRDAIVRYARGRGGDPRELDVTVDCGNGMASRATPQVLRALGAGVVALNANVDGHFPGRPSKPTPESLSTLRAVTASGPFDFGIGHDGDADRIAIVDGRGDVVHEDTVLAILAEYYVRTAGVSDPVVVTTPNASTRIDERVQAAGGRTERVRLGALHEGIERVQAAGGDVVFAGEPWKHVHPALGGWIDGIASAVVFTQLVADRGLQSLREPVQERPYRKRNVRCPDDRKASAMAAVEERLPGAFEESSVDTRYGVRVELPDGSWVLVRPSGTEPFLRVYAEGADIDSLVDTAVDVVDSAVAADT